MIATKNKAPSPIEVECGFSVVSGYLQCSTEHRLLALIRMQCRFRGPCYALNMHSTSIWAMSTFQSTTVDCNKIKRLKYFSASESILTKSVQSSPHVQSGPGLLYSKCCITDVLIYAEHNAHNCHKASCTFRNNMLKDASAARKYQATIRLLESHPIILAYSYIASPLQHILICKRL